MQARKAVTITGSIILVLSLLLLGGPIWGAIKSNRAFVSLNHKPSVLSGNFEEPYLATIEAQLSDAKVSDQMMLATIRQARGSDPAPVFSARELISWGQRKEEGGDLQAAEFLYRWATEQQPELGDGWYHLGKVYASQDRNTDADNAYKRSLASSTWNLLGPSDVYLARGNLYFENEPGMARDFYEQALSVNQFVETAAQARTHYQLGELLLFSESNPVAAIPHYQTVLTLTPDDHWARLRLGYALYWGNGQLLEAEETIQAAIAGWPDEKYLQWPYFYLGEIYQDAGLMVEAIAAYEQVLALDPAETRAQERLEELRDQ